MCKKTISIILICCFLMSAIFTTGVSAAETDTVPAWNFDATGLLTIHSASVLEDYESTEDVPWHLFATLISSVSIDEEISYIGAYTLNNLNATVEIANKDAVISDHAFDNAGGDFVIRSVYNSAVHTYAKEHGYAFEGIFVASGSCGEAAEWKLYTDGTLHITGTGAMTDYYRDPMSTPWYSYASSIKSVEIDEGITYVSAYTVFSANNCAVVTVSGADTQVNSAAFQTTREGFTVCGHLGSSAQSVATAKGYQFEALNIDSGACGLNVTWTLYTNGLLKIDGTGAMDEYKGPNYLPYYDYNTQITAIEIGEGVSKLSDFTYFYMVNCTSFTVLNPGTVFTNNTIAIPNANLEIRGYFGSTAQTYAEEKSISFAPCSPVLAGGTHDQTVIWRLHENGLLEIYGTGNITHGTSAPWNTYRDQITAVEVGANIAHLPNNTFYNFQNCTALIIRNPDITISANAVYNPGNNLKIYADFDSSAEEYATSKNIAFDSFILEAGPCGPTMNWILYTNGHMKLTGSGMMYQNNYMPDTMIWHRYFTMITSLEVGAHITVLPNFVLFNAENCTSVTFLGKNTVLQSATITIYRKDLVLYGYTGSTAEAFAQSRSISFVALD